MPRSINLRTRRKSSRSAPASAKKLGYDAREIDSLPSSVTDSFCGVGNPLGLGELRADQRVLELGSGPGMDSLLAARRVGPTGKVIGVDMCEEMIAKARHNAKLMNLNNVEFMNAGGCATRFWQLGSSPVFHPLTAVVEAA